MPRSVRRRCPLGLVGDRRRAARPHSRGRRDLIEFNARSLAAMLTSEQGKPIAEALGEVNHLAHGVRYYAEAATKVTGHLPGAARHVRPGVRAGDPPPDRGLRRDHPIQLPTDPAGNEGRPRAGDGQHGRRQARGDDAAGNARGGAPVRRGRRPGRRAERRHRARCGHRRRARRPSGRAPRRLHRLDRGRSPRCLDRRAAAEAGHARARRLGPGDRLRGRRRRRRRQGGHHRPLLERRTGVPRLQAGVRPRLGVRRLRRLAGRAGQALRAWRRARSRPRSRACGWARSTPRPAATSCWPRSRTASQSGGELLTGGGTADNDKGWFLEPAVVAEPGADSRLVTEEVFGPVLPIFRYSDFDDAIARANDTRYGLGSSIWTHDVRKIHRAAQRDRRRHDLGQPDPLRLRRAALRRRQGQRLSARSTGSRRSTATSSSRSRGRRGAGRDGGQVRDRRRGRHDHARQPARQLVRPRGDDASSRLPSTRRSPARRGS